jgi:CubicO group peptidase (beta-lactamase class C family)
VGLGHFAQEKVSAILGTLIRICAHAETEFFAGIELMVPSYLPWQTAGYSNIGYQLLSYVLESMTGKKFVDILNARVIKPLGLQHTYFENAPPSQGVIPTTTKDDYWWVNLGDANA